MVGINLKMWTFNRKYLSTRQKKNGDVESRSTVFHKPGYNRQAYDSNKKKLYPMDS